jgi:uncharacterized membrane protein
MKRVFGAVIVIILSLILFLPGVLGHVPVDSEENTTLERAQEISEPLKSWAIYDKLDHEEEGKYYYVNMKKGERLFASLLTPDDGDFAPSLLIMGPNLGSNDSLPEFIDIYEDADRVLLESEKGDAEYEPFTPAANYPLAEFDREVNASGTYYIVVFSGDSHGRFILAVGFQESFTVVEWLKVPLDLMNIYLWSGHSPIIVILPFLVWLIIGLYFLLSKMELATINSWLFSIGGLMYLGSATLTTVEMGIALIRTGFGAGVIVTLIFILIPVLLGLFILLRIMKKEKLEKNNRIAFFIYGILGLLFWCGVIVGPVLIILASVLPIMHLRKESVEAEKEEGETEKEDGESDKDVKEPEIGKNDM